MMRNRYIISILTLVLFAASVFGKPVTLNEVRDAVSALMQSLDKVQDIKNIEAKYLPGGELGYYMVELEEKGWALVSADDAIRPILAFSFENNITLEEEWNDAAELPWHLAGHPPHRGVHDLIQAMNGIGDESPSSRRRRGD